MTDNIPYVLQLKEGVNAIHLSNPSVTNETNNLVTMENETKEMLIQNNVMDVEYQETPAGTVNYIYEIIYPEQMNLKPVYSMKRGRPKKKKVEEPVQVVEEVKVVKLAPRTRSGRVVKFPKHIEKDFKKVELEDAPTDDGDLKIKISDFNQYQEEPEPVKSDDVIELVHHQRRRKIASQYCCPKCGKAYLGRNKMIQHIKKNPDHGPLPVSRDNLNFDVWNYLVDITQKCPPAQRGIKFCEELTNLLHNVSLLTSALFKEVEENKNHVDVDKVLGNAIGLAPGQYKFNDNELYKDVTVLKLITNTDFFKPVNKVKEPTDVKQQPPPPPEVKENSTNTVQTETEFFDEKQKEQHNMLCTLTTDVIEKKQPESNHISVHLLSENSLLTNLRNSVPDELMLAPVDSGGGLLDNSTSSDEVMNVDQFVNERFKKITEPEIVADNGLNLDLPSLDLFQFHTS